MICVDRIEGIRVAVEGLNGCFFLLFLRAFVDIKNGILVRVAGLPMLRFTEHLCRGGGIGRRASFRCWWG